MPVILKKEDENAWLNSSNSISNFAFPYQAELIAIPTA